MNARPSSVMVTGVGFSSRVKSEGSQGSCPLAPQRSGLCRLSLRLHLVWCTPGSRDRIVLIVTFLRRNSSVLANDELGDAPPLSEATADLS